MAVRVDWVELEPVVDDRALEQAERILEAGLRRALRQRLERLAQERKERENATR
ncbi:MAG: hypothetical protein ACOY93_00545 [Bacillota bacterium]